MSEAMNHTNDLRLPTNIKPTHYDIALITDLLNLKYWAYVTVDLNILQETSTVAFNTAGHTISELHIDAAVLQESTLNLTTALKIDPEHEKGTVQLPVSLSSGSAAKITFAIESELSASMAGYYRSAWKHEGTTKYYSLESMQPTAARKAFPCWDEPSFKATFSVTMISTEDTVNLSNMSVASEGPYNPNDQDDGRGVVAWMKGKMSNLADHPSGPWKVTQFDKTPLVSTHLYAPLISTHWTIDVDLPRCFREWTFRASGEC